MYQIQNTNIADRKTHVSKSNCSYIFQTFILQHDSISKLESRNMEHTSFNIVNFHFIHD